LSIFPFLSCVPTTSPESEQAEILDTSVASGDRRERERERERQQGGSQSALEYGGWDGITEREKGEKETPNGMFGHTPLFYMFVSACM